MNLPDHIILEWGGGALPFTSLPIERAPPLKFPTLLFILYLYIITLYPGGTQHMHIRGGKSDNFGSEYCQK